MSNAPHFVQTNPKPEDLGAQIYAMHVLLIAMIQTHPDKDRLRRTFEVISGQFFGILLNQMVPESHVEEVRQNLNVIAQLLRE